MPDRAILVFKADGCFKEFCFEVCLRTVRVRVRIVSED